jgi:RHS repeat-associated protein
LDYVEARYFDPALGMFRQVDPHFDKYLTIDPFNYGFNIPMMIIDTTGMDVLS